MFRLLTVRTGGLFERSTTSPSHYLDKAFPKIAATRLWAAR